MHNAKNVACKCAPEKSESLCCYTRRYLLKLLYVNSCVAWRSYGLNSTFSFCPLHVLTHYSVSFVRCIVPYILLRIMSIIIIIIRLWASPLQLYLLLFSSSSFFFSFFSNRSNPFIGVSFYFWKWCVIWVCFFILNFKRLCMTVPWNGHTTVSSLLLARPVFHMGAFCFLLQGLKTVKHTEKVKYMMLNMHSLLLTDLGMSE